MLLSLPCYAQVGPAEIRDPQLKAAEQAYLPGMVEMNRELARIKFPFSLMLSRYAGLSPKEQIGADARGLEFVRFHGRVVLKITGNYNAAYNADLLSPNQRAGRVFADVIVPILCLIPDHFTARDQFDAVGFEIAYHVRTRSHSYEYEGKEILAVVLDKNYALGFPQDTVRQQELLNRSEIYLDGKPFGLALGMRDPFDPEAVGQSARSLSPATTADGELERNKQLASTGAPEGGRTTALGERSGPDVTAGGPGVPERRQIPAEAGMQPAAPRHSDPPTAEPTPAPRQAGTLQLPDLDALQKKYQARIDTLAAEGLAKHHFVDYAPPSFVVFRGRIAMQLTLRNPTTFDREGSSIYKRAAQSFDLFLAPQLKPILDDLPDAPELSTLDITVIDDLEVKSGRSSEALEYVFSVDLLRRFVAYEVTNQELIDQSTVLVNGVRIALNLQLVE